MKEKCPTCHNDSIVKKEVLADGRVKYQCKHCTHEFFDYDVTDEQALAKIRDEKQSGIEILYRRYAPQLENHIRFSPRTLCQNALKKNPQLNIPSKFQQDVAQEICGVTFCEFYKNIDRFQDEWKVYSQLWFIASHRALDYLKSRFYKQGEKELTGLLGEESEIQHPTSTSIEQSKNFENEEKTPLISQENAEQEAYSQAELDEEQANNSNFPTDIDPETLWKMEQQLCLAQCVQKMLLLIKNNVSLDCYEASCAYIMKKIKYVEDKKKPVSEEKLSQECQEILRGKNNPVKCYIARLLQKVGGLSIKMMAPILGKELDQAGLDTTRQFLSRGCRDKIEKGDDPVKSCLDECRRAFYMSVPDNRKKLKKSSAKAQK